jgi:cytochrome c-type biogenesis protein CcmH/NrfG
MIYLFFCLLLIAVLGILLIPVHEHKSFCMGIGFFIGAFLLYGLAGSPQILPLLAERDAEFVLLKKSMQKNSDIVKTDPKNLAAWVELGQDFLQAGQWEAAVNALKQAVLLSNGDVKLILAYAKAQILVEGGKVTDEAKKSLQMVLIQEPKNEEARYYLAVRQLQDGHPQEAMKAMKSLYQSLPEGSPVKAMMDRQIGKTN